MSDATLLLLHFLSAHVSNLGLLHVKERSCRDEKKKESNEDAEVREDGP